MSGTDTELEVKFYLSNRSALQASLDTLGQLVAPRVHEVNLRFDTPDLSLSTKGQLLRLRMDTIARLTFKGEGSVEGGARLRKELEVTVSDYDTAKALFEALGYQVYTMYEKYRTTYRFDKVEVTLDELPTGDFLEIEGPDGESIRAIADQLGLNWEARILDSYTMLFEQLRRRLGLKFKDLSFENFTGLQVSPDLLGVVPADQD